MALQSKLLTYLISNYRWLKMLSHIVIYRSPISPELLRLCHLAKEYGKPVFFDIDDLVFDTVYTDQLSYTQGLNSVEKGNYDAGVRNYGYMLENCDGAITSTNQLQRSCISTKVRFYLIATWLLMT